MNAVILQSNLTAAAVGVLAQALGDTVPIVALVGGVAVQMFGDGFGAPESLQNVADGAVDGAAAILGRSLTKQFLPTGQIHAAVAPLRRARALSDADAILI